MTALRGKRVSATGFCSCCNDYSPVTRIQEKRAFQKEIAEDLESFESNIAKEEK